MPRDLLAENRAPRDLLSEYQSPIAPLRTGFQQGITFGFGDEMGAGIRAAAMAPFSEKTIGEIYAEQLRDIRGDAEQSYDQSRGMALVGELMGGAVQGGGAAKLAGRVLPRLSAGQRLTGVGGAEGALYGAGTAEGGTDRLKGAAAGGMVGAALPVPLQAGMRAVGGGVRRLGQGMTNTPTRQANRIVQRALEREGLTPEEALERLSELGPEARLADILPETARGVTAIPGPGRQVARDFLEERQAGQQGRLISAAGIGGSGDFKRNFRNWMQSRHTAAKGLYRAAYESPFNITSPQMQSLLQRPTMQEVMRKAERILRDEGGGGGHVRILDAAKRELDDRIGTAMRQGAREEAARLINLKRSLVQEVDRQVPSYAKARAIYSGEAGMRDAGQLGRRMFTSKTDPIDDVELRVLDMSDAEKLAFQRGALRGILDRIEGMSDTRNAAQKLIESPRSREILQLAFRDKDALNRLIRTAEAESQFSRSRNTIRGGSPTARIQEEVGDIRETAGLVGLIARGEFSQATAQLLQKLGIGKVSDETIGEVSKILFGQTPRQLERGQLAPPRSILPPSVVRRLPRPATVQGAAIGATGAGVTSNPQASTTMLSEDDRRRRLLAKTLASR